MAKRKVTREQVYKLLRKADNAIWDLRHKAEKYAEENDGLPDDCCTDLSTLHDDLFNIILEYFEDLYSAEEE